MCAHAREAHPAECCGLIGGQDGAAHSVYRLRNVARDPLRTYEGAPEDLFAAQREMRERGEKLLGIYHSHPRTPEPEPSETDVRLAFYPSAVYFIIGMEEKTDERVCVPRAFQIFENERRWERVEFHVVED